MNHFFDRQPHKIRGIQCDDIINPVGHGAFELFHGLADRFGHIQSIGTGLLINHNRCGGFTVESIVIDILPPPHFGPGYIPNADYRTAVRAGSQDDVFIFRGLDKRRLSHHRKGQLNFVVAGLLADLAGTKQGILLGNRILNIGGGNAQ